MIGFELEKKNQQTWRSINNYYSIQRTERRHEQSTGEMWGTVTHTSVSVTGYHGRGDGSAKILRMMAEHFLTLMKNVNLQEVNELLKDTSE